MTNKHNNAATQRQDEPIGPVVLLAGVTGRTPSVPENAAEPEAIRLRATEEQVRAAPGMAREISNEATYRDDFGKRPPDPATISAALLRAKGLSDEAARAEVWLAYLKNESQMAWQHALELTGRLQEHYDVADRADPGIALRYPDTAVFLDARSRIAERAVVSRKRNRPAKTKTP